VLLAGILVALTGAAPGALAAPAISSLQAHATGNELVQVGRDSSVVLAVNAETTADMVQVDILLPAGFTPDLAQPPTAKGGGIGGLFVTWDAHYSGREITASGDGVADGGILVVTFMGRADQVGTLLFVTVTHAADGTTVRWDGPALSEHPAAFVHVLRTLTSAQVNATIVSGPAASHPPQWAIGVAVLGGLVLVGCLLSGRRRGTSGNVSGKVSH
jgi:hypothetical protein